MITNPDTIPAPVKLEPLPPSHFSARPGFGFDHHAGMLLFEMNRAEVAQGCNRPCLQFASGRDESSVTTSSKVSNTTR